MIEVRWGEREGRESAHRLLLELLPAGARLGHACPECAGSEHGRPVVVGAHGLWVSLSRAPVLDLVAVSDEGPVGVDVEELGAATGVDGVLHVHPGDDPTWAWVRTEAVLKATGRGLAIDPRTVRLRGTTLVEGPDVLVDDLEIDGHAAALARARRAPAQPPSTGSAGSRSE